LFCFHLPQVDLTAFATWKNNKALEPHVVVLIEIETDSALELKWRFSQLLVDVSTASLPIHAHDCLENLVGSAEFCGESMALMFRGQYSHKSKPWNGTRQPKLGCKNPPGS